MPTYRMFFVFCLLFFTSCINRTRNTKHDLTKLYEAREILLDKLSDANIWRRGSLMLMVVDSGNVQNIYSFLCSDTASSCKFSSRHTQFSLKSLTRLSGLYNEDSLIEIANLELYLNSRIKLMDSLKVHSVSTEFTKQGIDVKYLMFDGKALLYVKDTSMITNPNWKKYVAEAQKLDDKWYFSDN